MGRRSGFRFGGLRSRLVFAFTLVALATGLTAMALAYVVFVYRRQYFDAYIFLSPLRLLLLLTATIAVLLVLTVGLALLAARQVLRPVRQLNEAAERITRGEWRVRLPVT